MLHCAIRCSFSLLSFFMSDYLGMSAIYNVRPCVPVWTCSLVRLFVYFVCLFYLFICLPVEAGMCSDGCSEFVCYYNNNNVFLFNPRGDQEKSSVPIKKIITSLIFVITIWIMHHFNAKRMLCYNKIIEQTKVMGIFVFEIVLKKSKINKHFILLPDNDGTDEKTSPFR